MCLSHLGQIVYGVVGGFALITIGVSLVTPGWVFVELNPTKEAGNYNEHYYLVPTDCTDTNKYDRSSLSPTVQLQLFGLALSGKRDAYAKICEEYNGVSCKTLYCYKQRILNFKVMAFQDLPKKFRLGRLLCPTEPCLVRSEKRFYCIRQCW